MRARLRSSVTGSTCARSAAAVSRGFDWTDFAAGTRWQLSGQDFMLNYGPSGFLQYVNLDHLQTVSKDKLGAVITVLPASRMDEVRSALLA